MRCRRTERCTNYHLVKAFGTAVDREAAYRTVEGIKAGFGKNRATAGSREYPLIISIPLYSRYRSHRTEDRL
jgi:hypothetical protein